MGRMNMAMIELKVVAYFRTFSYETTSMYVNIPYMECLGTAKPVLGDL